MLQSWQECPFIILSEQAFFTCMNIYDGVLLRKCIINYPKINFLYQLFISLLLLRFKIFLRAVTSQLLIFMPHCYILKASEKSEVDKDLICTGCRYSRDETGGVLYSLFCSHMVNFKTPTVGRNSSSNANIFAVEPHYGTLSWAKLVHTWLIIEVQQQKRKYSN